MEMPQCVEGLIIVMLILSYNLHIRCGHTARCIHGNGVHLCILVISSYWRTVTLVSYSYTVIQSH